MPTDYMTDITGLSAQARGLGAGGRRINVKRLMRLRLPLMIGVSAVIAAPLMLAIWLVVASEYKATSSIQFSPTRQTISTPGGTPVSSDYSSYVETQVGLIKDITVVSRALERPEVRALPLIREQRDPVQFLVNTVQANLRVNSQLVDVSFSAKDRDTAVTVVKAIVEEYMKLAASSEKTSGDEITKELVKERDTLVANVAQLRQSVSDKRESIGGIMGTGQDGVDAELRAIYDNLTRAQAEQTTAEKQAEQMEGQLDQLTQLQTSFAANASKPIYQFGIEESVATDSAVQVLSQDLASTDAKLSESRQRYVESNPRLATDVDKRESLAKELARTQGVARARVLESRIEKAKLDLETAHKSVDDAKARVQHFETSIQDHTKESLGVMKAMAGVREAEQSLEDARTTLRDVQEHIRVLQVESRAPMAFEVKEAASAPKYPNSSRRLKMMAVILMGACAAGMGAGVWRELTDQTVRSAQDVQYVTDLPLIASVPDSIIENLPASAKSPVITADHPDTVSSDEYRRILTRIIYPPEGTAELNTVLVTSATRGDGKTSVACNLAISLAQANRRVLLLDVCARRPSVERALGLTAGPGLAEILAGHASADEVIRSTSFENLSVLGPGLLGRDVIGKLASRDAVSFLEQAEQSFEHVIIDTPPALLMADARLLAPVVDGVIVVIGSDVTTLGMAQRCLANLQQIGANVVGIVLNRLRHTPGGYMQSNLDKFYNYEHHHVEGGKPRAATGKRQSAVVFDEEEASIILMQEENERLVHGGGGGGIRPKRPL